MRKRVLSLALLCCFAPPFGLIHAAETEQAEFLVLKMADSKTAEFKLSTQPVIAFLMTSCRLHPMRFPPTIHRAM